MMERYTIEILRAENGHKVYPIINGVTHFHHNLANGNLVPFYIGKSGYYLIASEDQHPDITLCENGYYRSDIVPDCVESIVKLNGRVWIYRDSTATQYDEALIEAGFPELAGYMKYSEEPEESIRIMCAKVLHKKKIAGGIVAVGSNLVVTTNIEGLSIKEAKRVGRWLSLRIRLATFTWHRRHPEVIKGLITLVNLKGERNR